MCSAPHYEILQYIDMHLDSTLVESPNLMVHLLADDGVRAHQMPAELCQRLLDLTGQKTPHWHRYAFAGGGAPACVS